MRAATPSAAVAVALLLLVCCASAVPLSVPLHEAYTQDHTQGDQCTLDEEQQAQQQHWIVRFKVYTEHANLHSQLTAQLPAHLEGAWAWVPRDNRARAYPTDFALLSISAAQQSAVHEALLRVPDVRDIHPDRCGGSACVFVLFLLASCPC